MEVYKQCICFHQSWLWPAYKGRWTSQIPRPVQCLVGSHQSRTPWKSYCHCLFHKHLCWNLWSREILQHCLLDQVQHSCLESWIKGLMLVEILKPKLTHKILNKILKTEVTHKGNKLTVCNHGSQLFSWHSFHGDIIKLLSSWKIMRQTDSVIKKTSKICNVRTSGRARCYFSPQKCSRRKVGEVRSVTFLSNVVNVVNICWQVLLLVWKSWNVRYDHCGASDIQLTLWQFFCTGSPFHCLEKYTTRLVMEIINWKTCVLFEAFAFSTNIIQKRYLCTF